MEGGRAHPIPIQSELNAESKDRGRGLLIALLSSPPFSELPIPHDGRKWRNDVLPLTEIKVAVSLPPPFIRYHYE